MNPRYNITMIWAQDVLGGIGINNQLPWDKMPADMEMFSKETMGKVIVMGRKTYESIGKPLKGRINVVLTNQIDYPMVPGLIVCNSVEQVLQHYGQHPIVIIGGKAVYEQFEPYATKLIINQIEWVFETDTVMMPDLSGWRTIKHTRVFDNGFDCTVSHWERK